MAGWTVRFYDWCRLCQKRVVASGATWCALCEGEFLNEASQLDRSTGHAS